MEYKLIRSRRRTAVIHIKKDGTVEVRAPLRLSCEIIDHFVSSKESWIEEKTRAMISYAERRRDFAVEPGGTLTLLGKEYPVDYENSAAFDGTRFFIPKGESGQVKRCVVALYKELAIREIESRVEYYSCIMGLVPSGVKIGRANTSWGTCSAKNGLIFTWKLVMAEPDAVDYVVVHELAHIREHNHSARFWALVHNVLPDYAQRREKLKKLQNKLINEDWD